MRVPNSNIFLVGLMASGKTTLGRILAKHLNKEFIDCDLEIEEQMGVSIGTMFDIEGEEKFRIRESDILGRLVRRRNVVLATGGGAVLSENNRRLLRDNGLVVFLDPSLEEIVDRLKEDKIRPLLQCSDKLEILKRIAQQRKDLYAECSHLRIDTTQQSVAQILTAIRDYYNSSLG